MLRLRCLIITGYAINLSIFTSKYLVIHTGENERSFEKHVVETGSMVGPMALVEYQARFHASDAQMDALTGPNGLVASMIRENVDLTRAKVRTYI